MAFPDDYTALAAGTSLLAGTHRTLHNEIAKQLAGPAVVNVKAYGAVGDNVTDDTAAIQAAIDAVNSGVGSDLINPAGAGVVFMPKGTYKISSALTVYTGIRLVGASRTATRLVRTGSGNTIENRLIGAETFSMHISLEDFSILGGSTFVGSATGAGINFSECVYFSVKDVGVTYGDATNGSFAAIRLAGCLGGTFINVKAACRGTAAIVGAALLVETSGGGIDGVNTMSFIGCQFRLSGRGIYHIEGGGRFTFIGCIIESNTYGGVGYGAHLKGASNWTFIDCHFENHTLQVVLESDGTNSCDGVEFLNCSWDNWDLKFDGDVRTKVVGHTSLPGSTAGVWEFTANSIGALLDNVPTIVVTPTSRLSVTGGDGPIVKLTRTNINDTNARPVEQFWLGGQSYRGAATTDRVIDSHVQADTWQRFTQRADGTMEWGSGSADQDVSLSRSAADVLSIGAGDSFRTGRAATASRPSAVTAGAGSWFYDTTLSLPIFSDGTVWRDAAGTAV